MVKTVSKKEATTSPDGTKKQRKKQAKQEAKTMLKLEQAKKNEQKAEKKITKMQEKLETIRMQIHKFEIKLSEIRSPHQEPAAEVAEAQPDAEEHEPGLAESPSSTAGEENARSENRADISIAPGGQKTTLSEGDGHVDVAYEQETTSPAGGDRSDNNPGQEAVQPADGYTYISVGSEQGTTFVEEGE